MTKTSKTLRLVLGDQLNLAHPWFDQVSDGVTYVLMELRSETDYATHHIQKIVAFFCAMRNFAQALRDLGHQVVYVKLNDQNNLQAFDANLQALIAKGSYSVFEYQLPDEYRLDQLLKDFCAGQSIATAVFDTEHFLTDRNELGDFFKGRKTYLMEAFYHYMRKKHDILMVGGQPMGGRWNFDSENRQKIPKGHRPPAALVFGNDVSGVLAEVQENDIQTLGTIDAQNFPWPLNRKQSLALLDYFVEHCLPSFGTFQDAMVPNEWSLYHSRLSFSMNTKMISPKEVIDAAIARWEAQPESIALHQLEGFVRQILGWREYMRGMYWLKPEMASLNYFDHKNLLPDFYWTGKTKMHCVRDAVTQSLQYAYAHHIQRLMVTGNFALLAGVHPDAVDAWYLGIYIDAIEWVELPNTRGMSQFADGGMIATKPYVSSAAYINKMSGYCSGCFYDKSKKTGHKACPFNSLYWHFFDLHKDKLQHSGRLGMVYALWQKMKPAEKHAILEQAAYYLAHINAL